MDYNQRTLIDIELQVTSSIDGIDVYNNDVTLRAIFPINNWNSAVKRS